MKAKEKKVKKHRLLKHPVLGWLVWTGVFCIIVEFLASLFDISAIKDGQPGVITSATSVILAVLMLLYFRKRYSPEYLGCIGGGKHAEAWKLTLIPGVFIVVNIIGLILGGVKIPSAVEVMLALMAGVGEEACFRAAAIPFMMRAWKFNEKRIVLICVLSGMTFGCIHLANIVAAELSTTIAQTMYACGLGIAMGAIFIRTGDILPLMVFHFVNDLVAFFNKGIIDGAIQGSTGMRDLIICIGMGVVMAIAGLYLVRENKRGEIAELWRKKWSEL